MPHGWRIAALAAALAGLAVSAVADSPRLPPAKPAPPPPEARLPLRTLPKPFEPTVRPNAILPLPDPPSTQPLLDQRERSRLDRRIDELDWQNRTGDLSPAEERDLMRLRRERDRLGPGLTGR